MLRAVLSEPVNGGNQNAPPKWPGMALHTFKQDGLFDNDRNETGIPRNDHWTQQPSYGTTGQLDPGDTNPRGKKGKKQATVKTHPYTFGTFFTFLQNPAFFSKRSFLLTNNQKGLLRFQYFGRLDRGGLSRRETETKTPEGSERKRAPSPSIFA